MYFCIFFFQKWKGKDDGLVPVGLGLLAPPLESRCKLFLVPGDGDMSGWLACAWLVQQTGLGRDSGPCGGGRELELELTHLAREQLFPDAVLISRGLSRACCAILSSP